jgi:hypothetical protein
MTNRIKSVVYGLGGFDKSKPNNNVVEVEYYSDEELPIIEAQEAKLAARQAILDRLGLTEEEARLLLG